MSWNPHSGGWCGLLLVAVMLSACEQPAPCPSFEVSQDPPELFMIRPYAPGSDQRAEAMAGNFIIRGEEISLRVPIDWRQDPFDNRSWCMYLHSLDPLKPLLYHYRETGEVEPLFLAHEIARDWIEANPLGADHLSEFAWYDMAVAFRAARLSYLHRALQYEQLTTDEEADRLGCALTRHARWLHNNDHYRYSHNHGIYSDIGLFIAARQLDAHPEAAAWRSRATERFEDNITSTVSTEDGLHLEHSPVYHTLLTEAVRLLNSELGLGDSRLAELEEKMTSAAAWLVMPDGRYPQFGDTDLKSVAPWALEGDATHRGFAVFRDAGAAVYRDELSYFMTVAWYHSKVHKQSDELSFVWAEAGRRLVVDSGRYGYFNDEPGRIYAKSSPAHSTLTLDRAFVSIDHAAYGSGVVDAAEQDGWYAVLSENPLLAAHHQRVFAYGPGRWLVVVDQLDGPSCSTSTRRFHFAPALVVDTIDSDALRLTDPVGSVWLQAAEPPMELHQIRGQMEPIVQGFTFPGDRDWQESTAVELVDEVCGAPMVTVLSVGGTRPVISVTGTPGQVEVLLDGESLSLHFDDDSLSLYAP